MWGAKLDMILRMVRQEIKKRIMLGALTAGTSGALYAEGVLKSGWVEVVFVLPIIYFLAKIEYSKTMESLLVFLISLSISLCCIDFALRPLVGKKLAFTPEANFSRKLPYLPSLGRFDSNVDYSGTGYGDLAAMTNDLSIRQPREIAIQTDDRGFRNQKVPNIVDVLVLGDSFGAGMGTTQKLTFASLLETKWGHQVYNLSFPACGPYQQFLNFAIESPSLKFASPSVLLWIIYTGNDLEDLYGDTWDVSTLPKLEAPWTWKVSYRPFMDRSPINRLMERFRYRFWKKDKVNFNVIKRVIPSPSAESFSRVLQPSPSAESFSRVLQPSPSAMLFLPSQEAQARQTRSEVELHPHFPKLERTFAAMRLLAKNQGLSPVVLILPTKGEVYRWILEERLPQLEDNQSSGFAQAMLRMCDRVQLHCLDTKPYLVEEAYRLFKSSGMLLWWSDDTHLNENGHAILAAWIAREVLASRSTRPVN